jgi:hypothetical protein
VRVRPTDGPFRVDVWPRERLEATSPRGSRAQRPDTRTPGDNGFAASTSCRDRRFGLRQTIDLGMVHRSRATPRLGPEGNAGHRRYHRVQSNACGSQSSDNSHLEFFANPPLASQADVSQPPQPLHSYRPENPRTTSENPENPIFYSQSRGCQQVTSNFVTPSSGAIKQ